MNSKKQQRRFLRKTARNLAALALPQDSRVAVVKAATPPLKGTSSRRARELARIARDLDQHKSLLAYGKFESWATSTYSQFPIQVLRYLRKSYRVFGKDLQLMFERYGQKKVFLLLGLDDPWSPVEHGLKQRTGGTAQVEELSVKQLRNLLRGMIRRSGCTGRSSSRATLGGLSILYERLSTLWPRVRNASIPSVAGPNEADARRRLERFRNMLEELLGKIEQALVSVISSGQEGLRTEKADGSTGRTAKTSSFLD
jgi:hypothetical protein